jgi:hypothetical protein
VPAVKGDDTVTGFESDVRLQTAFRALSESPAPEVSEEVVERIWLAVSGELPADERRELIDRMASDPACAEAWRVAHELWLSSQGFAEPSLVHPPTRRWWSPRLAAAAALLVATTAAAVVMLNRPSVDEFRASPGYVVQSLVPADTLLPRAAFRLRWTPGPQGSRYQVRVTTDDLRVLATVADLTDSELVVAPDALLSLPDGATVFWQVDVSLATGERVTSPAFAVRIE